VIVLGVASAFAKCGWALVEREDTRERLVDHGTLRAVDADVVADFAGKIANGKLSIDSVVIEDAFVDTNMPTTMSLCRLVGRWQQAFEVLGFETRTVLASVWQRGILTGFITGDTEREGRKKAAQLWARATFGVALPQDEADAAGISTWEIRQRAFRAKCVRAG
jgi:hypothetical protein